MKLALQVKLLPTEEQHPIPVGPATSVLDAGATRGLTDETGTVSGVSPVATLATPTTSPLLT